MHTKFRGSEVQGHGRPGAAGGRGGRSLPSEAAVGWCQRHGEQGAAVLVIISCFLRRSGPVHAPLRIDLEAAQKNRNYTQNYTQNIESG